MAEIVRKEQKIFGESGGASEFGQFGSDAAGSPTTSKDLDVIQALSQYGGGWFDATADAAEPPRIEDRNGLDLLMTTQLAYMLQKGIPEWLDSATQRYYAGKSIVTRSDGIYMAILGDDGANINAEKDPVTEPLWWTLVYQKPVVEAWDSTESVTYEDAGVVVDRFGTHYTSTGLASNLNKDPALDVNSDYWYASPGYDRLEYLARNAEPVPAGMHKIHDLGDGDYNVSLLLDKRNEGGTTYEYYLVHLDGTQVTLDATLESIFGTAGTPYSKIDIYAPDSLGTRTLIDMRGRTTRSMTTGGGEADTLGEVQLDQMQRIAGEMNTHASGSVAYATSSSDLTGAFSLKPLTDVPAGIASTSRDARGIDFDSANSPNARTSATTDGETRMANLVKGIDYIIVKKAA